MGDPGTLNLVQWQCMLDKGKLAMLQNDLKEQHDINL